jgi:signal transduction histidine kinase
MVMRTFIRRFIPLVLLVGIPFVLVTHLLIQHALDRAEENAKTRMLGVARLGAFAANEYLGGLIEYAGSYSRRPMTIELCAARNVESGRNLLKELVESNSRVDRAFFADPNGILWADYPAAPELLGQNVAERDWFKGVKEHRASYLSQSYLRSGPSHKNSIAVAVPLLDGRRVMVGILVCQVLVDSITRALATTTGEGLGAILLIDRQGTLSGTASTLPIPMEGNFLEQARQGARAILLESSEGPILAGLAPVPVMEGAIVAVRRRSEAMNGAPTLAFYMYVLAGLFGIGIALVVHRLIGDRDARIEELQREEQRQRVMNERKSDFVAYLAHEIRSPLTAIIGFTDLILSGSEGDIPEIVGKDLTIIKDRGQFILSLVSDLLDTTKIEAGRMEIHPDVFPPAPVARKVMASLEPIFQQRGLQLKLEESTPPPVVKADPRHTEQILSNLISNALKFTREGGVTVQIESESDRCLIRVADTGPGMGPEDLQRIFERYATLHRDRSAVQRDTGLGLYLSKQLAELQGGKLWVESERGKGTRVTISLPTPSATDQPS